MMKKILLIVVILFSVIQTHAQELTFATNINEDYPHLIGNTNKIDWAHPGITIEILQIVARNAGVKINFVRMPWKRCLIVLERGEIDAVFFASYKKEREKYGAYPKINNKIDENKRYAYAPYVFYKKKADDVEWDGKILTNLNGDIGTSLGYSIANHLREKGYNVNESLTPFNDFKKLALNRVGIVAALEHNGDHILDKNPDFKLLFEKINKPIIHKAYYLLISHQLVKSDPKLAQRIWEGLEQARIEYYDAIYGKYIRLMD